MRINDKDFYNSSGYADPTAYLAAKNIQRDSPVARVGRFRKLINKLAAENGFEVAGRIKLKDMKTGFVFK